MAMGGWVVGAGGVKLVLRFPMEEGIVEYQRSFPEVSPKPKSDS